MYCAPRRTRPHSAAVAAPPAAAFAPVQRIGGATGRYGGARRSQIRGWLDVVAGRPGLRRGRRDPVGVRVGDTIDFWRVEAFEPNSLLRLAAELKVPGRAWPEFEARPAGTGASEITQTAIFEPNGPLGLAYWYALWPMHGYSFGGMLRAIAATGARDAG